MMFDGTLLFHKKKDRFPLEYGRTQNLIRNVSNSLYACSLIGGVTVFEKIVSFLKQQF